MELRKNFVNLFMNKDLDEKLNHQYSHADNITIETSQGNDYGVLKNIPSTIALSHILSDYGNNNFQIVHSYLDKAKQLSYLFINTATYSAIVELHPQALLHPPQIVLLDSRENRVLDFSNNPIISARKIHNYDTNQDLLIWSNSTDEIFQINIERAKNYGENNFTRNELLLIKKPPFKAPNIYPKKSGETDSFLEEVFVSFGYRYKYFDNMYSALSPLSYYQFYPSDFEIDYENMENKAMLNMFNEYDIEVNTGDHTVQEIQIIAKFSNSTQLHIVEELNKSKLQLDNNQNYIVTYSNNQIYLTLPNDELARVYDNVPRKAHTMELVDNRIVVGNYSEGYDMIDTDGNPIKIDFTPYFHQVVSSAPIVVNTTINDTEQAEFEIPSLSIPKNTLIKLKLCVRKKGTDREIVFNDEISTTTKQSYANFKAFVVSSEGGWFTQFIANTYADNYIKPSNITANSSLVFHSPSSDYWLFNVLPAQGLSNNTIEYEITSETKLTIQKHFKKNSLKSGQEYTVGIVYEDEFGRASTPQICKDSSIFLKPQKSTLQNKLRISIKNKPPYWAKSYRFAIKTTPIQHENIYANIAFKKEEYTYIKLDGDNVNKVKVGDELIYKNPDVQHANLKPIKVLEIKQQEENFINIPAENQNSQDIKEPAGLYMKINSAHLDLDQYTEIKNFGESARAMHQLGFNYPQIYSNATFTDFGEFPFAVGKIPVYTLKTGSSVNIYIESSHHKNAGWQKAILNKKYFINNEIAIKDFLAEKLVNPQTLYANEGNCADNYAGRTQIFQHQDKPYFAIKGTRSKLSGGRDGYITVKITITESNSFFVFENKPKREIKPEIFYLSSERFPITNNQHLGNVPPTVFDVNLPIKTTQPINENITFQGFVAQPIAIPLQDICEIDYFNCYSFGNGIESYKVKDNLIKNSLNIDYTPTAQSSQNFKEVHRYSEICWSEPLNEETQYNAINQFRTDKVNYKDLDKTKGEIKVVHHRNESLIVVQNNQWGQIPINQQMIKSADSKELMALTSNLFGQYIPYQGEYGIHSPNALFNTGTRIYAVDKNRGTVLRLSNNGLIEITNGMIKFFKQIIPYISEVNIGYDYQNDIVHFTFRIPLSNNNVYGGYHLTFKDNDNGGRFGWVSFLQHHPQSFLSYYSTFQYIKFNQIWQDDNNNRNTIFGNVVTSKITFDIQTPQNQNMIFKNIKLESETAWDTNIKTNFTSGTIAKSEYKNVENYQYAYFRKNETTTSLQNRAFGIGPITQINGNEISFHKVSEFIQPYQNLHYENEQPNSGTAITIQHINGNTITVDNIANLYVGQYCYAVGSSRIVGEEQRGNHATITLSTDSTNPVDIFGISINAVKSSN